MRAWAQLFLLGRRWPALGNMTRRKPWGLGEPYGESGKPVLPKVLRDIEILDRSQGIEALELVLRGALIRIRAL